MRWRRVPLPRQRPLLRVVGILHLLLAGFSAWLEVQTWSDPQAGWGMLAILSAWPWIGVATAVWLVVRWRAGGGSGWIVLPGAVLSVPVTVVLAIGATRAIGWILGVAP